MRFVWGATALTLGQCFGARIRFPHGAHLLMEIQEHIPLAPFTTFSIGGRARFFARVANVDELKDALAFAKEKNLPVFILGGGSNVLFDDLGYDGLVVKNEMVGLQFTEDDGMMSAVAGAGESWESVVAQSVAKNLWGLENLSGIPGTVGGAVVQNIGAYGAALSQTFVWAEVFDTTDGSIRILKKEDVAFGYRDSIFKREEGRYVALRVAMQLSSEAQPNLSYKDLSQRFSGTVPTLEEIRNAVLLIRKNKFPDLAVEGTAGSFFKNPIVTDAEADALKVKYPDMPVFSMPETSGVKIPLAWLFDRALNMHGLGCGKVRLFERQPLVVAAARGASSRDVRALARMIVQEVKNKLHIEIEPEVKIVNTK